MLSWLLLEDAAGLLLELLTWLLVDDVAGVLLDALLDAPVEWLVLEGVLE